ncbi:HAD family hydrolase [Endozoicomonas elysicola]|uniref:HAD family hydrolase n=1 Tax=Endozoicomonas elysicola TaxID=305900 RepID=A0A081KAS8_9GAMM|nr:HAD family phosphatase [Endozoicomonas elysicola]KEI71254.1 HAD family hydrolase [Endozoicomonas elysicola]
MQSCSIKNVVFDIGNVLVRWSPLEIIRLTFGESEHHRDLLKTLFQGQVWLDLNKGLMTEAEAKIQYQQAFGFSPAECDRFFYYVKQTQILIYGSLDLLNRIKKAGYRVYALTDNINEIIEHLKSTYDFWPLFDGVTVSAEVGLLKPQPEIYFSLLSQQELLPSETVFIDDMPYNVEGARGVGMFAIQFNHALQCEKELKELGLVF